MLGSLGLECFAKTSGSKGLHLSVPLNSPTTFAKTKEFAHAVALLFEREDPKGVTSVMSKALRKGKIFVDWSQNDDHKTTVCVYSLRAREHPTVSTPVKWAELEAVLKKKDISKAIFEAGDVHWSHGEKRRPVRPGAGAEAEAAGVALILIVARQKNRDTWRNRASLIWHGRVCGES